MENELRLAVLIDADNAPRTALREVMAEVAVYGSATIKRIYGDWTAPNMGSWKPLLLEHAITPFQQYSYTTGKYLFHGAGSCPGICYFRTLLQRRQKTAECNIRGP